MAELRMAISIVARSAISVGAGGSAGTIADRTILRDGYGRPLIPGSQLKGKIRHAAESLLGSLGLPRQKHFDDDDDDTRGNAIRRIFGSPRCPSPLRFADLLCTIEPELASTGMSAYLRPSVAIHRRRGVAEDERLLLIEASREGLIFAGERAIVGRIEQQTDAALLWAALGAPRLEQLHDQGGQPR